MEDYASGALSGNDKLQHLLELSRLISATTEGDSTQALLGVVSQMFSAEGAVLWLLNDQKSELVRRATFHTDSGRSKAFEQEAGEINLKFGQALAGLAWAEGKVKAMQMPGMFAQSSHSGSASKTPICAVAFPLMAGGTTIGVMELINCADQKCDGEAQQALVGMLSGFVGNSIFGAYAVDKLQQSSIEMTQLQSRAKAIEEDLRELKQRLSKEHDQSVQNARFHAQFLTRISRDIRTPLSGITSIVELMLRSDIAPELREYTNIVKESAASVLTVLEELVEFSKQEAELFAPANGASPMASVGEQKSFAGGAGAESAALPPVVTGLDKIRVLVITGLIGSAEFIEAYATASGIRCESTSRGQWALMAMKQAVIVDSPYDVVFIERLLPDMDAFEFVRAVRRDNQLADTKMVLVSTFDSSSRDDFALRNGFDSHIAKPMKQQQVLSTLTAVLNGHPKVKIEEQEQLVREQIAPAVARGQRMILVAEDNPVNQKVALLQLRELGFFATVVGNGREAVDVLKQAEFDAVLMDCQMPEVDGFEATKQIREWEQTTGKHVPIIAMTASALSSDRENCLAVGMDDYLSKPVTYDKLNSVLSKWVESDITQELAGERKMQQPNQMHDFSAPPAGEPVDIKGLNELLGEDETAEVLQLFVQSTEELIAQIKDASDRRDSKSLKEAAHQLKGAAASVGANSIARTCLELETCAKSDNWDGVPKLHQGLAQHLEIAKNYIHTTFS
jgi:CheY-like chemotaxis protein